MIHLVRVQGVKIELWLILMDLFTHLTFQVWCKVESYPKPFRVRICQNAQVIDIVEAAIQKEKLQTTSSFVNVKFEGEELMPGAQISQYSTSDGNPLLLELLEPQGKLHAVMYIALQVLGEPCNLHSGCYGVEPGYTIKHYNVQAGEVGWNICLQAL